MALKLTIVDCKLNQSKVQNPHCVVLVGGALKRTHVGSISGDTEGIISWGYSFFILDSDLKKVNCITLQVWDWYHIDDKDYIGNLKIEWSTLSKAQANIVNEYFPLKLKEEVVGEVKIELDRVIHIPAVLEETIKSEFDDIVNIINATNGKDPVKVAEQIPKLINFIKEPVEVQKKDKILSFMINLCKTEPLRVQLAETEGALNLFYNLLNRKDYLYQDTQKLVLTLLANSRKGTSEVQSRVNKYRGIFIDLAMAWIKDKIASDVGNGNVDYTRTLEILRCCSVNGTVIWKMWEMGLVEIVISKFATNTRQDLSNVLQNVLINFAKHSEIVRRIILKILCLALKFCIDYDPNDPSTFSEENQTCTMISDELFKEYDELKETLQNQMESSNENLGPNSEVPPLQSSSELVPSPEILSPSPETNTGSPESVLAKSPESGSELTNPVNISPNGTSSAPVSATRTLTEYSNPPEEAPTPTFSQSPTGQVPLDRILGDSFDFSPSTEPDFNEPEDPENEGEEDIVLSPRDWTMSKVKKTDSAKTQSGWYRRGTNTNIQRSSKEDFFKFYSDALKEEEKEYGQEKTIAITKARERGISMANFRGVEKPEKTEKDQKANNPWEMSFQYARSTRGDVPQHQQEAEKGKVDLKLYDIEDKVRPAPVHSFSSRSPHMIGAKGPLSPKKSPVLGNLSKHRTISITPTMASSAIESESNSSLLTNTISESVETSTSTSSTPKSYPEVSPIAARTGLKYSQKFGRATVVPQGVLGVTVPLTAFLPAFQQDKDNAPTGSLSPSTTASTASTAPTTSTASAPTGSLSPPMTASPPPEKEDFPRDVAISFRFPNYKIQEPSVLVNLILEIEKLNSRSVLALVDGTLNKQAIFFPPKSNSMWQKENDEEEAEEHFDDVVFFSLYFSGCLDADIINQLSEQQCYYYIPFIVQYDKKGRKGILTNFLTRINQNPELAMQSFFMQKINNFWGNTTMSVWRASKLLENTSSWITTNLFNGKRLKEGKVWKDVQMIDPLFLVKGTVSSVKFVKAYSSHVKPMLLHFNHDNEKDSAYCIYKRGDDLRQDYVVQTMFFLFNRLWKSSPLPDKPFIHQYKILPLGEDSGILEFVHGCQAAGEWQWKILLELPDRDKVNFFKSMAGSYLACWVLGIRDRHQDNMMIKDNKIFFHIDFGFIFNDAPGFDAPIFSIPGDFRRNITQDEWNFFLKLCGDAFAVLHRNSGVIINACTLLMQELPTISVAQVRKYLVKSLMVRKSEKSAKQKIREEISAGIVSTQKELKYLVHGFATKKIWTSTPQN